jgi:hypothetical protein
MNPNLDRIPPKHRTTFRDWLALLLWDLIYALGAVIIIALITLLVALISLFSR